MIGRRIFCLGSAISLGLPELTFAAANETRPARGTLLTAPLELGMEWGGSAPNDARAVLERMRGVSLAGIKLVSDQQPIRVHVDDHSSGPPAIWLHTDHPDTAW